MATKTITILCSECGKPITITAQDAHILWRFNGGFPRLKITVGCPHCNMPSIIHESPEAHELLDERIKSHDYDYCGTTLILESPEALNRILGKNS